MNLGSIGGVQGLRPLEEVGAVRPAITPQMPKVPAETSVPARDFVSVEGAAAPEAPPKSVKELRADFQKQLRVLKDLTDDDKAFLVDLHKRVDARADLNKNEKEWLFVSEIQGYTAIESMKMTSWDKKGQPWTPTQENRFRTLAGTNAAAKDLVGAITPLVEKPDSALPSFEAAAPGGATLKAAAPEPAPFNNAAPGNGSETGNTPPPGNETPVEPPPSPDPMVRIWEARRREAQDMATDWQSVLQKTSDWKQRIFASRLAFFWKIYGMHCGYLNDSWRR